MEENKGLVVAPHPSGLQNMITDFDDWLVKFKQYTIKRFSYSVNKNTIKLEETQREQKKETYNENNVLDTLLIKELLVNGVVTHENFNKDLLYFLNLFDKYGVVSWGDSMKPPVLMIHGYMDSAATFIPLVQHLPDTYYYVAFDMPGHGKSDPFPRGLLVSTAEQVEVVRLLVERMRWKTVALVTHSVGFFVGVIYNCVYPKKVTKIVNLDPRPPINTYCFNEYDRPLWFQYTYQDYYENYDRMHQDWPKQYTYEEALETVMRNRKLRRDQAEIVLSRILLPQHDGRYKFSWEARCRKLTSIPISEDTLYRIVSESPPPMLNILASEDETVEMFKQNGQRLIRKFQDNIPNFTVMHVTGHHDVHITNPGSLVNDIVEFLNKDFDKHKSRL